ncbi:MAG: response regulator transcription factor [Ignavibacteriae bacterium]|nr:response regulator transcription factor [Ignavibacteriota bacterium]
MKKVIIVEDIKTIREGLKDLIDTSKNLQCIQTFENFEKLQSDIANLNPDILLIDLDLPGISGIDGIKKLNGLSKKITIIVLTLHEENERIFEALSAGASNYLVKNTPAQKMISIIEDAAEGKVLMNSFIARKTFDYFKKKRKLVLLDKHKKSILNKVVEGNNLTAIEQSMNMKISDIRRHFKGIYEQMHALN